MSFQERPWGHYAVLHSEDSCQVKKLSISPGRRISLQSHKFRAEHWFVVSGEGVAELNNESFALKPGSSVDVAIGVKHRITCKGRDVLVLFEVQTGAYFGEEDIVRYEDDYGRVVEE